MSVIVTTVDSEIITMTADTGFSDGDSKWSDTRNLKIVHHQDFEGEDILVGVTGNAIHLAMMKSYLQRRDRKKKKIVGTSEGVFKFLGSYRRFTERQGTPVIIDSGESLSAFHLVADGRAFSLSGYFITEIHDWECMGSGDPYARAIMWDAREPMRAVNAACQFDLYCSAPIINFEYDRNTRKVMVYGGKAHSITYPTSVVQR